MRRLVFEDNSWEDYEELRRTPIENGTILAYRRTYFFKANKYGISLSQCT